MTVSPRSVFIVFVILLLLGYGFWQARDFLRGPRVYLSSSQSSIEGILEINGLAKNVSRLELNGYQIFTNEAGNFSEKRVLVPGINNFELTASDRFGHRKIRAISVFKKD